MLGELPLQRCCPRDHHADCSGYAQACESSGGEHACFCVQRHPKSAGHKQQQDVDALYLSQRTMKSRRGDSNVLADEQHSQNQRQRSGN